MSPNDQAADSVISQDLDSVELLIKPVGADCNLGCTYCFYHGSTSTEADRSPEPAPGRSRQMTNAVLRELIRQAMGLRRRRTVFCWQGGEPTLAGIPFFERAIAYVKEFGRGGQVVGNAIQTNGVLLSPEWAGFLKNHSFQVGISLDGPPALHDRSRRSASGTGTHQLALEGARRLAAAGIEVNCLSVVTDASVAGEVYPYLVSQGFRYLQFIPCLQMPRADSGCQLSPEHYGDFLCELFDLWWNGGAPATSVRLFGSVLTRMSTGRAGSCDLGETCGDYVVVEHDGSVYPCDFFVSPDHRLGNITETPLEAILEGAAYRRFKDRKKAEIAASTACSGCRWLLLCHGGCPAYWEPVGAHPAASHDPAVTVTPFAADGTGVSLTSATGTSADEPDEVRSEQGTHGASWRYCSSFRSFLDCSHERLELLAG